MTIRHRVDHISVCVCTYRRPDKLRELLSALEAQETNERFSYSIVVVDNDGAESARHVVETAQANSTVSVRYFVEPERNIAVARNRTIRESTGNFIALIDDDEIPCADWLASLLETSIVYGANGVLGPVVPRFEVCPPRWVLRGGFCNRPRYKTGTVLNSRRQTRTGNALLERSVLVDEETPFDPKYGLIGGEDVDFFERRLQKGDIFVWCDEGPVFESVPPERMKRIYMLRRALLRGMVNGIDTRILSRSCLKSLVASLLYSAILPLAVIFRHEVFMRYLIRDCDHIGKLLAVLGFRPMSDRSVTG